MNTYSQWATSEYSQTKMFNGQDWNVKTRIGRKSPKLNTTLSKVETYLYGNTKVIVLYYKL
jgi:hypothetical protein